MPAIGLDVFTSPRAIVEINLISSSSAISRLISGVKLLWRYSMRIQSQLRPNLPICFVNNVFSITPKRGCVEIEARSKMSHVEVTDKLRRVVHGEPDRSSARAYY
jgi:hypothetical protein